MPRMLVIAFLNFLIPFFGVVAIPPCPQGEKISLMVTLLKLKYGQNPGMTHKNTALNELSLDGVVISHLPDGPTAHFKLSSIKLGKEIRVCCVKFNRLNINNIFVLILSIHLFVCHNYLLTVTGLK